MKKTLEELTSEFRTIVGEEDTRDEVISFLEDLTDSFSTEAPDADTANRVTELEGEVESWKKKYRDRFYGRMDEDEEVKEERIKTEEKPDGEKIRINDLFEEKKED